MDDQMERDPNTEFQVGDNVPRTGVYQCGVSGDKMTLEKGEEFPECEPTGDAEATWVLADES